MAFPPPNTQTHARHTLYAGARRKRKHNMQHSEDVLNDVQQIMERAHYGGGGKFFEYDNAKSDSLSYCTSLICQSLFLSSTSHRTQVQGRRTRHSSFALERAQMWVLAAHSFLRTPSFASSSSNTPTQLSLQDILLTVLIIVTVYAEVSASRSSLVRRMLQSLSVEEDTGATSKSVLSAKLNCIVRSVIIRTMKQKNDFAKNLGGLEDLRPVSDVLSHALSREVFFQLVSALRSLPCARTAMLSVSRKYLQSPFSRGMECTSIDTGRGAQNNNDRNEKAIYALCILILDFSKDECKLQTPGVAFSDECGREAWAAT